MGSRLAELHPKRFFLETWRELDEERLTSADGRYDYRPLVAFAVGAVMLTLMEYFGATPTYLATLERLGLPLSPEEATERLATFRSEGTGAPIGVELLSRFHELGSYLWWSGARVLGYFVGPALTVWIAFRGRLRDYGLETRGFHHHAWIYATLYGVVLVAVVGVSFLGEFSSYYPFYKLATRSWFDFAAWELLYAAQFFSLEFFFRGFWLNACRKTMGSQAIFAMVVPYCMIHFGKPWLEALGAIAAGVVLGTLAMKTRSIWSGFLIHVSVALSMDVAAILQTSRLPAHLWPT